MKDLSELKEINLIFSSVNQTQSNGTIQRFHSTITEMIRVNSVENPNEHPFTVLYYAVIGHDQEQ